MVLRIFKRYGTGGGLSVELPGSHPIPEGNMAPSARGRGLSRKVSVVPPVGSPVIGEGSSRDDHEKSGVEQRISAG